MNEKKSFGEKLDKFFAGKGFYIVLFLCVAIIGVSTYFLLTNGGTDVDESLSQVIAPQGSAEIYAPPPVTEETPYLEAHEDKIPVQNGQEEQEVEAEANGEVEVWNEQEAEQAASALFVWPLEGEITLPYSVTALIRNEKYGDWRTHDGVDIAAALGTQVVAVSSGTVVSVAHDDINGMTVVIEHAGGLRSIYSNLASVPTVYEGDSVVTGEIIGAVGATALGETPEAPRLCFKMKLDGLSVDPGDYLPAR